MDARRAWQRRLDDDFPRGMILVLEQAPGVRGNPSMPIARVMVAHMANGRPVVVFGDYVNGKAWEKVVRVYEVARTHPVTVVRLHTTEPPNVLLGGNINAGSNLAERLQRERDHDPYLQEAYFASCVDT